MSTLLILFFTALGASTLLPMQSEAVLLGLLALGDQSVWVLLAVATAGNVINAQINWLLGRLIAQGRGARWFPVDGAVLERASARYQRHNYWMLLLNWLPMVGDPLTMVAGVLREPFWRFTVLVLIAKGGRYAVLAAVYFKLYFNIA
jgi:membrane protein YqaA with SNARE-associated domain